MLREVFPLVIKSYLPPVNIARVANDHDAATGYEEIDCNVNGEYTVGCRKEGGEIYLPFSFVRKYFDVYGKLATYDGYERFEWSHSYSKVYYPKGGYDPRGVYMYFENYNVEVRERVKCVSGVTGESTLMVHGYGRYPSKKIPGYPTAIYILFFLKFASKM